MKIRWTVQAAADFENIVRYIARDSDEQAWRVASRIVNLVGSLGVMPKRHREGPVEGTRETPVPGLPYVIAYRVGTEAVEVVRIWHGKRRRPFISS